MIQKFKYLFLQRSMLIFLLIGGMNTLLNWALMLLLDGILPLSDDPRFWVSSAIGYTVTSAISFVLNRKFSFASKNSIRHDLPRFVLVIAACYLIANYAARPLVGWALSWDAFSRFSAYFNQVAMIFGNVVFTILNYFGQRFFAFKREDDRT